MHLSADLAMMKVHNLVMQTAVQNMMALPMAVLLVSVQDFPLAKKTVILTVSLFDSMDLHMPMQHSTTRVQKAPAKMDRQYCSKVGVQHIQKRSNRPLPFLLRHSQFCFGYMLAGNTKWKLENLSGC